jgi:ketosteroid isomerase-like protein
MSDKTPLVDSSVLAAIDAQHELMRKAFETKNADSIANDFYTPEAWVVGPEQATWKGSEQIFALYKDFVGNYRWETRREQLIPTGTGGVLEYLTGAIDPVDGGEKLTYKILFAWTKHDGKWLCATQFFAPGAGFSK